MLEEIVTLCGHLPLALRIAAALLRGRRTWTLQHLAARLRTTRANLTGFSDGDRDLASVFDLSYQALDSDRQIMFRYLGLVPGPDVDAYAAAALLDVDIDTADQLLQDLVDHNLLAEIAPGRYRLHDLLRLHARTTANAVDNAGHREAAVDRLLHYYAHTAQAASARIGRVPRQAHDGPAPACAPDLAEPDLARAWLRTERPNLDAAWDHAHAVQLDHHITALATGLAESFRHDGPWTRAQLVHQVAETVARSGPSVVHANALTDLGRGRRLAGDYRGAGEALAPALEIYQRIGNQLGEAVALSELGEARYLTGDYLRAAEVQEPALEIYRRIGNRLGEATALNGVGRLRFETGDMSGAADAQEQALAIYRELGNRYGEAAAQTNLGEVRYQTGDYPEAAEALERALEIFRQLENRHGEAINLTELGHVRAQIGDFSGGIDALELALEIFRQLGSRLGEAASLNNLGRVRHMTGDYLGAAAAQEQSLEIYRQIGSRGNEGWALNSYAASIAALGDLPRALTLYQQALAINRELNMLADEAISLEGIADHYLTADESSQGITFLNEALEIYRRLGMRAHIDRVQARLSEPGTQ
ncbi:tetratricopeptide repeat protein [Catenulispora yoronensis]